MFGKENTFNPLNKIINYISSKKATTTISTFDVDSNDNVISLKKRMKTAYPSSNGLYPHELQLLYEAEKYKVNSNIPESKLLKSLVERNFLKTDSIIPSLDKAKVTELKKFLKENNLKVSGKKEELISRLLDNVPETQLKVYFPEQYYCLTDKGIEELEENNYISYINKKSFCELDIWEANIFLHKNPNFSIKDASWNKFNMNCAEHFKNHDYGLYRNTRCNMALQLIDEDRLQNALEFLFEVCYIDLSGLSNGFEKEFIKDNLDYYFPYENSGLILAPFVIGYIVGIIDSLNLVEKDLEKIYLSRINKLQIPFHVFTKQECFQIILNKINDNASQSKKIYLDAEKRLRQQFKK